MKKQHIIWFLLGMGLLASMSSCQSSSNGLSSSQVRDRELTTYKAKSQAFNTAAGLFDEPVTNTDIPNPIRHMFNTLQVQMLDSAAYYHKLATAD